MIALIDGDIIAYRCAASCEKQGVVTEDLGVSQGRSRDLIQRILSANNTNEFVVVISGKENFRKTINPEYKANRKDMVEPRWLKETKQYLVDEWNAELTNGIEADDRLGILQTEHGDNSIICTLDKDLRQVPGWHYSWEISGTSVKGLQWVRPEERLFVSPQEGLFNFYWQLIMGDASDNVFGFDGKARQKVPKFLEDWYHEMQSMSSEQELFDFVRSKYNDDNRFLMNGRCLYIQRQSEEDWLDHALSLMEENGRKDASIHLLFLHSALEQGDGLPSMKP